MKKKHKKDPAFNTFLDNAEIDDVRKSGSTSFKKTQLNECIYLINLCEAISNKYDRLDDSFEVAVKGMRVGLFLYRKNDRLNTSPKVNLVSYLSWCIKTAIEYELGEDNEDTREWVGFIDAE